MTAGIARPAYPLLTERLTLRPFEEHDLETTFAMQRREDVVRYLYWGPRSRDEVRAMLTRFIAMTAIDDDRDAIRLAVVLRDTGTHAGDVSLWRTSREHAQGEIGFMFHPDHRGRGYATEALRPLLRIGFQEARLHRIVGRCDGRNAASARVMERLGMRCEAHLVENEWVKGEWTDELVYAMLAAEWAATDPPDRATPLQQPPG